MGVTASLALLRVHVLVVELPGRSMLRLRAEAAVRARGWVVTAEPEDADLVLVCGRPRPETLLAVDALWARVPRPRARRTVRAAEELPGALDSAAGLLADDALQRRAATGSAPSQPPVARLGPIRSLWPAGLVADCALDPRGQVVAAGIRRLRAEADDDVTEVRPFLVMVADAARLLRLAGWTSPALRLDRVVDLALAGRTPTRLRRRLRGVAGTLRRSATLRWVLKEEADAIDVRARVLALLTSAIDGTEPPPPPARNLIGHPLTAVPMLVAATERVVVDG